MERAFIVLTNVLLAGLLLSSLLHLALLVSDSSEYRQWVWIQIVLQLAGAWALWHVRQYRSVALIAFVVLSVPFTFINAVYTNYGHIGIHLVVVPLFWLIYGALVFRVRHRFAGTRNSQGEGTV